MLTKKSTIFTILMTLFVISSLAVGCDDHDHDSGECGGHGHLHDGHCHCDEGYMTDPANEANCIEDTGENWCIEGRDGWERCEDDVIMWCHEMAGSDPHPHAGQDCGAAGLECVQVSDSEAACVDTSSTCTDGEFECSADNEARNCIDGNWAIEPCGTLHCHEEADEAHCEEGGEECGGHGHLDGDECHCDDGYMQDPTDATNCVPTEECGGHGHLHDGVCHCDDGYMVDPENDANCIEVGECGGHGHLHDGVCHCDDGYTIDPDDDANCVEIPFPQRACDTFAAGSPEDTMVTTTFDDVFSDDYHVHLDELMRVTLPDNETSFIHFPISEAGDYVIFLDTVDVFTTAWHRDHKTEFTTTGDVPNGMCKDDLVEHWHITATYDGDGSGPVPGVIEFAPVSGGATVQFIVSLHEDDH